MRLQTIQDLQKGQPCLFQRNLQIPEMTSKIWARKQKPCCRYSFRTAQGVARSTKERIGPEDRKWNAQLIPKSRCSHEGRVCWTLGAKWGRRRYGWRRPKQWFLSWSPKKRWKIWIVDRNLQGYNDRYPVKTKMRSRSQGRKSSI